LNNNSFINCYNQNQTGYYLDIINNIFYPCHNTCKECKGPENNQCLECFDNYTLENGSCFEITETDTIISNYKTHSILNNETNSEDIKNEETIDVTRLSEINSNSIIKTDLNQDTISIIETNSEKTIDEVKSDSTIFSENNSDSINNNEKDTIIFNNDDLSNTIFSNKFNPSTSN
jgi:hypothetical protein